MPQPHRSPSPISAELPSVGYLGPEGTFSEEALLASVEPARVRPVPIATIYDAVMAVQEDRVRWSLVPIENSIEGSVTVTLDTLAGEAADVVVVGELVIAVRQCLIASTPLSLDEIQTVVSHPQAAGQCARFLRGELPAAVVLTASSTADAVRIVSEAREPSGPRSGPGWPRRSTTAWCCATAWRTTTTTRRASCGWPARVAVRRRLLRCGPPPTRAVDGRRRCCSGGLAPMRRGGWWTAWESSRDGGSI